MYRPLQDNQLKFLEKSHRYKVGNTKLCSVTSWIKSFFVKFEEAKIAKYVALARQKKGEKITATQVRKEWKLLADAGTDIHKDIELYVRGEKTILDIENQKTMNGINQYHKLRQRYPNAQFFPELRIYSIDLLLAGTIDLLVITQDGRAVIVDWKTNKKIDDKSNNKNDHPVTKDLPDANLTHYTLQLSAYAYILEKEYGLETKALYLEHLFENECREITVPYVKEMIEQMVIYDKADRKET